MALGAQTQGKLLDYEQFIDHQLGLTRARIKMTDVLTAGVLLVAAVLGVLFLEVVLDHLVGLPFWFREIVLVAGLAGAPVVVLPVATVSGAPLGVACVGAPGSDLGLLHWAAKRWVA